MKSIKHIFPLFILILTLSIIGFIPNIYYLHLFNLILIYSIFSLGLNILTGYTGITSFGHAGFFALGAYATAILSTRYGVPPILSIFFASFFTGIAGFIIGLPVIRISGIYLAMVTLASAEFIRLLALNWDSLTGGPVGISNIPALSIFGCYFKSERSLFFFLYVILIISTFIFVRITNSRFGKSLIAIKDDEQAAESIGIPCAKNKLISFFISGLYSGLSGALYAHFDRFIHPASFTFSLSVLVLCMVILGGMGTVFGSILGAILIVILLEYLQPLGDYRLFVYGMLLVIMISYFPQGLIGILKEVSGHFRKNKFIKYYLRKNENI